MTLRWFPKGYKKTTSAFIQLIPKLKAVLCSIVTIKESTNLKFLFWQCYNEAKFDPNRQTDCHHLYLTWNNLSVRSSVMAASWEAN